MKKNSLIYKKKNCKLYYGNCLKVMKKLKANSIDTIITDPPYGLSFMGKKWDYKVPSVKIWKEALRVLKPGGTLLCFAGSRTQHRMAINIEDAGFILKDCIMWLYGSGFPKATDISKQLDKGHKRKVVSKGKAGKGFNKVKGFGLNTTKGGEATTEWDVTEPSTDEAKLWDGWKSHGLKPAYEPILVAMKLNEGTYAENALSHSVSGLNIDGCRIEINKNDVNSRPNGSISQKTTKGGNSVFGASGRNPEANGNTLDLDKGRFPANIILDEEAGAVLDKQSGILKSGSGIKNPKNGKKSTFRASVQNDGYYSQGSSGGASRFFYCAKVSKKERNAECERLRSKVKDLEYRQPTGNAMVDRIHGCGKKSKNNHPTVKPLALIKYLCKLTATPTGGIVLDPFMGSGTTGIACKNLKRKFIGIELNKDYFKIAKSRIKNAKPKRKSIFEK